MTFKIQPIITNLKKGGKVKSKRVKKVIVSKSSNRNNVASNKTTIVINNAHPSVKNAKPARKARTYRLRRAGGLRPMAHNTAPQYHITSFAPPVSSNINDMNIRQLQNRIDSLTYRPDEASSLMYKPAPSLDMKHEIEELEHKESISTIQHNQTPTVKEPEPEPFDFEEELKKINAMSKQAYNNTILKSGKWVPKRANLLHKSTSSQPSTYNPGSSSSQ